jgi:hypothetical protein
MIKAYFPYKDIRSSMKKPEFSRLLSAAVINGHFCSMLLCDPASAAKRGYEGERFTFDRKEMEKLCAIHANSLKEFAAELAAI